MVALPRYCPSKVANYVTFFAGLFDPLMEYMNLSFQPWATLLMLLLLLC